MKRGWIGLAAVIMAVGCSKKDTIDPGTWNSYRNPVEQTDVQDPAVYEDNGTYYLFASGSDDSIIPMMVSSNLTGWELAISVFNDETKPTFISGVSADKPSVAKVGDKYLLYYSMFKSAENSGIGVAVADLVTGPYVDQGKLLLSSEYGITGVVSPSFFTDGTSNYLVFGNFGGIYIVELSEDGMSIAAGAAPTYLVVEAILEGKLCYYPVKLPPMESNKCYNVSLTVCRPGSSTPDVPVDTEEAVFKVDVQQWTNVPVSDTI